MTFTILPFAPKGALSARLPASPAVPAPRISPAPKAVLRATWSLDPETDRPVCRWSIDDEGTPARCPVPLFQAA